MSELDDLRSQNKELKRLLENALGLLEKSKTFLADQAKAPRGATSKKASKGSAKKQPKKASKS